MMYEVENPMDKAMAGMSDTAGTLANMTKRSSQTTEGPGATAGGALMSGMGGAAAGASIGSAIGGGAASGSAAGPWGAVIGAAVGVGSYLLS